MKVLSHPGHGNSEVPYRRQQDLFQFLGDISPLILEASAPLPGGGLVSQSSCLQYST